MAKNVKSRLTPLHSKGVQPLHRRILGRGAAELDVIDDLRLELERALDRDEMEYDTYLDCLEALDIRESKARVMLDKATGRYVKPDKNMPPGRVIKPDKWKVLKLKPWEAKVLFLLSILIWIKFFNGSG